MAVDLKAYGRRLNPFAIMRNMADNYAGPFTNAGAPTNGTSGTYAGYASPSAPLYDITNGVSYINAGTRLSPNWMPNGGLGGVQTARVAITNAQMLALRATPVTLVAAPGAGRVAQFVSAVLLFDRTAVYTETADNMAVKYADGSGTAISVAIESTGFVDAAADAIYFVEPIAGTVLGVKTLFENLPLVLHNTGDGEFGGGNAANEIVAETTYRNWLTEF